MDPIYVITKVDINQQENKLYLRTAKTKIKLIFKNRNGFQEAYNLFKKNISDNFDYDYDFENGGKIIKSSSLKLTLYCQFKLSVINHSIELLIFCFILLVIIFFYVNEIKKHQFNLRVKEIYEQVEDLLNVQKKVTL